MHELTQRRKGAKTQGAEKVFPFAPSRLCGFALKCFPLSAFLLFSGCATTPKHEAALTGDIMVDGPRMIAEGPPRDKVLWQYRTAAAAMRQGQFDLAKQYLDEALARIGGIYGKDPEARKARGYFHKEAKKTFIGEPYERAMAYFYRGVLYWMDGELDNARACFRTAEFEDSDAENKDYAGDWVLPDYLDGLATAKLGGDGADAFRRAQNNSTNAQPGRLKINLPAYSLKANVLFIVEFGPGPAKYATGQYHEELRFTTRNSPVVSARIKTGAVDLPVAPTDDVNFQATTRGGRVMDHVLANKAVFKSATDTAGNVAIISGAVLAGTQHGRHSAADEVGLGLLLAGVASKIISASTTPEADVRAWDNLPQFISFATLSLPVGQHTVTVEFLDAADKPADNLTKTITVNVTSPDRDKVVFVSDTSTTPQTQ
jgi:tetratricopeptide (TPR) repeat protein